MWEKYYTPKNVAQVMVDLIDYKDPKSAIDICAGSWNLLQEASNKWIGIPLFGIDTDKGSSFHAPLHATSIFHHMDGRQFALDCLKKERKFSVVLANPPFGKSIEKEKELFLGLPGSETLSIRALTRIESTMILANLSLIEENGYLGVIVPSTLVDGNWAQCLRLYISKWFQVCSIIKLPDNIFGRDISTSMLIIRNQRPNKNRYTKSINAEVAINDLIFKSEKDIEYDSIRQGKWTRIFNPTFREPDLEIYRGGVSSSLLQKKGKGVVLHSTDVAQIRLSSWTGTRYLDNYEVTYSKVRNVKKGDIVVIRVGRNCGKAALINFSHELPASDCIIILRQANHDKQKRLWSFLNSDEFHRDLCELRKGVSTFYLTANSLKQYLKTKIIWRGNL